MWKRGRGGTLLLAQLCRGFQSLLPLSTSKLGPSGADSPGRWVCVCSRTLWVSPRNSPIRLGVSPAGASPPTGVFNQRFEALFPCWSPGLCSPSCSPVVPPCLPAHECGTAQSTIRYLTGSSSHLLAVSPLCPAARLHPSYWPGCMCLLYLLGCQTSTQFDFLSVLIVFCF